MKVERRPKASKEVSENPEKEFHVESNKIRRLHPVLDRTSPPQRALISVKAVPLRMEWCPALQSISRDEAARHLRKTSSRGVFKDGFTWAGTWLVWLSEGRRFLLCGIHVITKGA